MRQRSRLVINAGNLIEFIAGACAVAGVYGLAGVFWALIVTAVLLVIGAEFIYGDKPWRVPLPLRPQPQRWLKEQRDRAHGMRNRAKWTIQRQRERRASRAG